MRNGRLIFFRAHSSARKSPLQTSDQADLRLFKMHRAQLLFILQLWLALVKVLGRGEISCNYQQFEKRQYPKTSVFYDDSGLRGSTNTEVFETVLSTLFYSQARIKPWCGFQAPSNGTECHRSHP